MSSHKRLDVSITWMRPIKDELYKHKCMIFYTVDCKKLYLVANLRIGVFLKLVP